MYFFRVHYEDVGMIDEHGAEFANDKSACLEAMRTARELAADKIINGLDLNGIYFEIARSDRSLMDRIPLNSVSRGVIPEDA
ncbi:DUF6894 family protein [Agrobacterium bohemicum]|uniref:DUF6894 family protein n=1 Tax=Agrobacterium bohemicum TaxID=2052828 RepID=UPI003CC96603